MALRFRRSSHWGDSSVRYHASQRSGSPMLGSSDAFICSTPVHCQTSVVFQKPSLRHCTWEQRTMGCKTTVLLHGRITLSYLRSSLLRLQLHQIVGWKITPPSFARLLRAFSALHKLDFYTKVAGYAPELELTCTSARPGAEPIIITVDQAHVSLDSDDPYAYQILRCLIKMDYHLKVTKVYAPGYMLEALNELLRHAGPSLEHLTLHHVDVPKMRSSPHEIPQFDLSENANLKFLSLTTRRELYEVEGPFAKYIPGLLSRVTSDHISCIDLDLDCLTGEILRESFSRLNSVLSRPVFNNLRNIRISLFRIRGLRGHGRIEKQDADLVEQLWLSFDKRNILGINVHSHRIGLFWNYDENTWERYDLKRGDDGHAFVVEAPAGAFKGSVHPGDSADSNGSYDAESSESFDACATPLSEGTEATVGRV